MRPAIRMAIITGASSLHMEMPTMPPTALARPRSTSTGPVCSAITPPMKNDRMQTISRLALPISKNWSNTFWRCRHVTRQGQQRAPEQHDHFTDVLKHNGFYLHREPGKSPGCGRVRPHLISAGAASAGRVLITGT